MLAIIIDITGGYLLAKYIHRIWLLLITAILVGIASSFIGGMLMHFINSEIFSPGETVARIIVGALWHPIVVIISVFFCRRFILKKSNQSTAQETNA